MKNNLDFYSGKKILITGNTGFKGSWLSIYLRCLGSSVYGLSDREYDGLYKMANVNKILSDQLFIDINNTSLDELSEIINRVNPDLVFHLAAQSLVSEAKEFPLKTLETNMIGTYKILKSVNNNESVDTLVIATTDKVYQFPEHENTEEDNLLGYEYYSSSKVGAENIINAFINTEKRQALNIATLRSGNVIGGGDRAKNRLMTDIVKSLFENNQLHIRNPKSIRPWTYILDSLTGYLYAGEHCSQNMLCDIFNLNSKSNNKYSVQYLINTFESVAGQKLNVIFEETDLKEVDTLSIDSSKAKNILNWQTIYDVEKSLIKIFEWEQHYQKNSDIIFSTQMVEDYIDELNE